MDEDQKISVSDYSFDWLQAVDDETTTNLWQMAFNHFDNYLAL